MENKKLISAGVKFFAAAAGIAVLAWCLAWWLAGLYPSFMKEREMRKETEPMLMEARSLALDYQTVLTAPEKYKDKYAFWCVQTGQDGAAFYKGDLNRRLLVTNHAVMPSFPGSKHANCTDMLLRIKSARRIASGGVITVEFLHKFK